MRPAREKNRGESRKKHLCKPRTTDSRHGQSVAPYLVKLANIASAPGPFWVAEIKYMETGEGWIYLALILGTWSRR